MSESPIKELCEAVQQGPARIVFTSGFPLFSEGPNLVGAYVEVARGNRWKRVGPTLYAPEDDNTRGGALRSLAAIADGDVEL